MFAEIRLEPRDALCAAKVLAMAGRGADPLARRADGDSPLMQALRSGKAATARALIPFSDMLARNKIGEDALASAMRRFGARMARELIEAGADPGLCDAQGRNALMRVVQIWAPEGIAEDWIDELCSRPEARSWAGAVDGLGRDAMMAAVSRHGRSASMALLGVSDPKRTDAGGCTALMRACAQRSSAWIEALLPVSDIAARDASGRTALMRACEAEGYKGYVYGWRASDKQAEEMAWSSAFEKLLSASDPMARDGRGRTALMYAASGRAGVSEQMIERLLEVSDAGAKAHGGATAADAARASGNHKLAARIESRAIEESASSPEGAPRRAKSL